ncbi:hypothetical protein [Segetibacter aerophilus]|uniref:Uncharacterized protein n=1 Tax=Segetibacter aerophilus TaxID=670293 RepID=A0A512B6V4_9BACT|nr:hypothetical protein [Segetibacter aerophilus]GEO07690.1 hypothetical protein SAE01_01860 [Segetibacter aerophilus]
MKYSRFYIATIFAAFILFAFWGCTSAGYNSGPVTDASSYPRIIERAQKNKRYFIMQSGINFYTVTSVDVDKAKKQLTVTLDKVDSLRLVYFKNPTSRAGQTQRTGTSHEIHMYMKDSTSYTLDEPHTLPLNNVARVELLD